MVLKFSSQKNPKRFPKDQKSSKKETQNQQWFQNVI